MADSNAVQSAAETVASGVVHEKKARLRDRIEPPADRFKDETAEMVEGVADQVRALGRQLDRRDEAHVVARRLERTADYLRFRPAGDVASDAWQVLVHSRVFWVAGGLLSAWVAYRLLRSGSDEG